VDGWLGNSSSKTRIERSFVLGGVEVVMLNRRSLPNPAGGTPDQPGVSFVLLECGGMPKVYSWMSELSEGKRYIKGRQID
jgi:hypothetical protein